MERVERVSYGISGILRPVNQLVRRLVLKTQSTADLKDAGLVKESEKRVYPEMYDMWQIYYQITDVGDKALAAELERYRHIVGVTKKLKPLPKNFAYDV